MQGPPNLFEDALLIFLSSWLYLFMEKQCEFVKLVQPGTYYGKKIDLKKRRQVRNVKNFKLYTEKQYDAPYMWFHNQCLFPYQHF